MKVLLTGGSGLLGKALTESCPDNIDLNSTWFTRYIPACTYLMDVRNASQVAYVFEQAKPDVVIHCAAVGSVDYTESHFTETRNVNVLGTENVLKAAQDAKALFVYISTNAVFDGSAPPYDEARDRQPVNRYGSIKREAENIVMASRDWLIIRPFMLYGYPYPGGRGNWFTAILSLLSGGETARLVDDTYWQPSLAWDVAQAIWRLIELGKRDEVYHVAGDERLTLFWFGMMIARLWGYSSDLIVPISSSSLKGIAPRPRDTTFKLDKIHELGIQLRSVEEGLKVLK